jgi:hypothetical protein
MCDWSLLVGGAGSFVLATVYYLITMLNGATEDSVHWLMFFIFCGPIVAIGGALWLAVVRRPIVTAVRTGTRPLNSPSARAVVMAAITVVRPTDKNKI